MSGWQYPYPTIQSSSTTTSNDIPWWLTNASQYGIGAATNLLKSGAPTYNGQLAPGMTADQTSAGNMIRNSVGAYQPYYDQAAGMTQASTGSAPNVYAGTFGQGLQGAINNYMNPYVSNVIDAAQEQGDYALRNNLNTLRDQAINKGAAFGSRHGVQEGIAAENAAYDTKQYISNALNQAFNQATGLMGQDISNNMQAQLANQSNSNNAYNRMLSAGSQMANIGTENRAANVADINNLLTYGGLQQQTQGAQDQAAYNYWLMQQNYPFQALQAYNQTVQGAPHSTTGTSNTTSVGFAPQQQQTSSPLMSGLGGAMAGAQMGSTFGPWGTAAGAAIGGGAGLLR